MPGKREKSEHFLVAPGSLVSGCRGMSRTKERWWQSVRHKPIRAALTKGRRGLQSAEMSHRTSVARANAPGAFFLSLCHTGLPCSVALAFYRGVQTDLGYLWPSSKGRICLALLGANAHSSRCLSYTVVTSFWRRVTMS